jgi:hypothetical protein
MAASPRQAHNAGTKTATAPPLEVYMKREEKIRSPSNLLPKLFTDLAVGLIAPSLLWRRRSARRSS